MSVTTGGRTLTFMLILGCWELVTASIVPLPATFISSFLFDSWAPDEALTVFVYCIIAATINMSGLSSQVVMLLINISLLNPQQELWAYFQIAWIKQKDSRNSLRTAKLN